jgi:hypothetical protein
MAQVRSFSLQVTTLEAQMLTLVSSTMSTTEVSLQTQHNAALSYFPLLTLRWSGPAPEKITQAIFEKSKQLKEYKIWNTAPQVCLGEMRPSFIYFWLSTYSMLPFDAV